VAVSPKMCQIHTSLGLLGTTPRPGTARLDYHAEQESTCICRLASPSERPCKKVPSVATTRLRHICSLTIFESPGPKTAMDVLQGTASIAQLVAYSSSTIRYLQRLRVELDSWHSVSGSAQRDVSLLLDIVERLPAHDSGDGSCILPILADIAGLVSDVMKLLQPKRILGLDLAPIINQERLKSSFDALVSKRALIHLYISRTTADTLVAIREDINFRLSVESRKKGMAPPHSETGEAT
jgi:hypothetical protein